MNTEIVTTLISVGASCIYVELIKECVVTCKIAKIR